MHGQSFSNFFCFWISLLLTISVAKTLHALPPVVISHDSEDSLSLYIFCRWHYIFLFTISLQLERGVTDEFRGADESLICMSNRFFLLCFWIAFLLTISSCSNIARLARAFSLSLFSFNINFLFNFNRSFFISDKINYRCLKQSHYESLKLPRATQICHGKGNNMLPSCIIVYLTQECMSAITINKRHYRQLYEADGSDIFVHIIAHLSEIQFCSTVDYPIALAY